MRDRWHSALKELDAGTTLSPADLKHRVCIRVSLRTIPSELLWLTFAIQNHWLYSFDAEADTLRRWHEFSSIIEEELKQGKITPLFGGTTTDIAA